ncbi:MAG: hypothetical protein CV087_17640 [Candidatus Brocadia sp. WS118]|nr:MAG: hypothetical protein CV087_17640 [Candidatus Brocadia sp. WS118]
MAIDLNDKTANGNNLTNGGTTEVTSDLPFPASTIAVNFDSGSSQYLYAADSASLSITGDLTLETWVKFTSLPSSGATQTLISKIGSGSPNWSYDFRFWNSSGTYRLLAQFSSDGGIVNLDSEFVDWTPSVETWYHVALTYTASSSSYKFYINGSQQGTTQTGSQTSIFNSSARLEIGAFGSGVLVQDPYNGKQDDTRIWNVVRTQSEISNNYNKQLTGLESGLQAYWPYNPLTNIKTTNGLVVVSVKTIEGLAIASVKSVNGLQ